MGFRSYTATWIALGLILLTLTGCGEMYRQPSVRPQEAPRLVPPAAAVPVTGAEIPIPGLEGADLVNPIPPDEDSINRGRILYEINCAMCHGQQGRGDGAVAQVYLPQPADLTSARVQDLADGDIFLRITNGITTMPAFRNHLVPEHRWHIVNYMRTLQ